MLLNFELHTDSSAACFFLKPFFVRQIFNEPLDVDVYVNVRILTSTDAFKHSELRDDEILTFAWTKDVYICAF